MDYTNRLDYPKTSLPLSLPDFFEMLLLVGEPMKSLKARSETSTKSTPDVGCCEVHKLGKSYRTRASRAHNRAPETQRFH